MHTALRQLCVIITPLAVGTPPACKKGAKKSAPQKSGMGTATMDVGPMKPTPPPKTVTVSPKVLPIPADLPALRFNVVKLRATA